MPKAKRKTVKSTPSIKSGVLSAKRAESSILFPILFLAVWLAFCGTVLIYFPGFSWMSPYHSEWRLLFPVWGLAFILLSLIFILVKVSPDTDPIVDISPLEVRLGLWGAISAAILLGSYHASMPAGNFADDAAYNMFEVRPMRDLGDFRNTVVFERGILPIWPYTAVLLWHLLPGLSTLEVQRWTGILFDVATIVAIYFMGKELMNRRVGLYGAVLAALSKPLLYKVVSGFNYYVLPFCTALVFWATLRLLKKDVPKAFLWWGIFIGLSAYSNFPIQPFIVIFIFGGLLLVWWVNRVQMGWPFTKPFVMISVAAFAIYALFSSGALPLDQWAGINLEQVQPIIACVFVGIALLLILLYAFLDLNKKSLWVQWVFGAWIAALLSFPALTHKHILERIRTHGWVQGSDYFSWTYISLALKHVPETFRALFWYYEDRPDMSLFGDPYLNFAEMTLFVVGLALCVAKPTLKRSFLLAIAALGLVPHFFAGMNHSGLLITCLVPFWIIGAIGLEEITEKTLSLSRSRIWVVLFTVVLVGWGFWTAVTDFSRVYTQWADKPEDIVIIRDRALADMQNPADRVYLSEQLFYRSADTVYDGSHFYLWNPDQNHLDIAPGKPTPNVVIYMVWNEQAKLEKKIKAVFPNAIWSGLGTPMEPGLTKAYRCEIPSADIEKKKSDLFALLPLKPDLWKRTWSISSYGLNDSGVSWEDQVADVHVPKPAYVIGADNNNVELKMRATIHIAQGGRYQLTCSTQNRTIMKVDDKKIFDLSFPMIWDHIAPHATKKETLNLEKGDHTVEVITYLLVDGIPEIAVKPLDPPGDVKSLWSGFSF